MTNETPYLEQITSHQKNLGYIHIHKNQWCTAPAFATSTDVNINFENVRKRILTTHASGDGAPLSSPPSALEYREDESRLQQDQEDHVNYHTISFFPVHFVPQPI